MDEVDRIIIHSLKTVGCSLDDDIDSLSRFSADDIYTGVQSCLQAISPKDIDAPKTLPPGMSQKFKAGSALAKHVKELGYSGEVGYQTFLYSNETDLRKIFMYLVDKLPKDTSGIGESDTTASGGTGQLLRQAISNKFKEELRKVWLPHVCTQKDIVYQPFRGVHMLYPPSSTRDLSDTEKAYMDNYLLSIDSQCPTGAALCSALIESHSLQLIADQNIQWKLRANKTTVSRSERLAEIRQRLQADREKTTQSDLEQQLLADQFTSQSRFTQLEKLQHTHQSEADTVGKQEETTSSQNAGSESTTATSDEEIREQQEKEVATLKKELLDITTRISKLNRNMEKAATATEEIRTEIDQKKKQVEDQKKSYQVKKKTLDVLPEAEQTILKVKQLINGADDRMRSLEKQWVEHQRPLQEELEMLKTQASSRQASVEQKLAEIQDMKQQMKSAADESKAKEELVKSLAAEYQSMTKDTSRSSYTKRIIEIVGNIKKQKQDIHKVLEDTRKVQKEINMLSGNLDRTFTVTDELIFRDAKRDESVRAAYKYLASLHDNFTAVRGTIEETGHILREIRQLEDQIDQEKSKDTSANLKKISSDYKQIKSENQQLMEKLKAASSHN